MTSGQAAPPDSRPPLWRWPLAFVLGVGALASVLVIVVLGAGGAWPTLAPAVWAAYIVAARLLGPRIWPEERPWLLTGALAFTALVVGAASVVGFFATYAIAISANLCGKNDSGVSWAGPIAGLVAYAVLAPLAARGPARRASWLWPLLALLAFAVELGVTAAIPSNHGGYCET